MSNIKFAKLCINEWINASRDKRELSVVSEFSNVDITVYAKGNITGEKDSVSGYNVVRISSRPLGRKIPNVINRIASVFSWASYIKKENLDVISGHDIVALLIAYLSNVFKKKSDKAKLIYDSHEFELGRNAKRNKITIKCIKFLEKFLMSKSEFSIMVNDSIAEEVKRIHNQTEKAVVVRNIPTYWNLDEAEILKTREEILSKANMPNDTFIAMYHGAVVKHRGADTLIEAISKTEDALGVILGNGDDKYIGYLKALTEKMHVKDRVLFINTVSIEELYKYVSSSNVGIITVQPVYKSYYYMLPNKFFENIQSLTPVIASDFPDIGKIIDEYNIGIKVNPDSIEDIAMAIETMKKDKKAYRKYKENLLIAKEKLCWENEKEVLYDSYKKVFFELEKGRNE